MSRKTELHDRRCEACEAPLKFLGTLLASGDKPPLRVFRCDKCKRIESQEMQT